MLVSVNVVMLCISYHVCRYTVGFAAERYNNVHVLGASYIAFIAGNTVQVYNVDTKACTVLQGRDGGGIGAIAVHPSKTFFAVAEKGVSPNIYIFQYPSLTIRAILPGGTVSGYADVGFNSEGDLLASVGGRPDYMLTVWKWESESIMLKAKAFSQDVFRVVFSPVASGTLVTGGLGHMKVWTMARTFTGLKLKGMTGKFGSFLMSNIHALVCLESGCVLTDNESGNMFLWEGNFVRAEITRPEGMSCHNGPITGMDLKNGILITCGVDGFVRLWDFEVTESLDVGENPFIEVDPIGEIMVGEKMRILSMVSSSDGYYLLQDQNGAIHKLYLPPFSELENYSDIEALIQSHASSSLVMRGHSGKVSSVVTAPSSYGAVSGGVDGTMRLYTIDGEVGMILCTEFDASIECVIWISERAAGRSNALVAGFGSGDVCLISITTGGFVVTKTFKPHSSKVTSMMYSPDMAYFVTTSQDKTVFFFSVADDYAPIGFFDLADSYAVSIKWRPDSAAVMLVMEDGSLWEALVPRIGVHDVSSTYEIAYLSREYRAPLLPPRAPEAGDTTLGDKDLEGADLLSMGDTIVSPRADAKEKADADGGANADDGAEAHDDDEPHEETEEDRERKRAEAENLLKMVGGAGGTNVGVNQVSEEEMMAEEHRLEKKWFDKGPEPGKIVAVEYCADGSFFVTASGNSSGVMYHCGFNANVEFLGRDANRDLAGNNEERLADEKVKKHRLMHKSLRIWRNMRRLEKLHDNEDEEDPEELRDLRADIEDIDSQLSKIVATSKELIETQYPVYSLYPVQKGDVRFLSFSTDGEMLLSGSSNGSICARNVANLQVMWDAIPHDSGCGVVTSMVQTSDGAYLLSSSGDGTISVYRNTKIPANDVAFRISHAVGVMERGAAHQLQPQTEGGITKVTTTRVTGQEVTDKGHGKKDSEGATVDGKGTAGEGDAAAVSRYTIEEHRRMSERDRLTAEGKRVQERMRGKVRAIRERYLALRRENTMGDQGGILSDEEMEIDVFLRQMLSSTTLARLVDVRKEFSFEIARRRVIVDRVDSIFMRPIAVERIALCSMTPGGRSVTTFRVCHLSEILKRRVAQMHALLESTNLKEAIDDAAKAVVVAADAVAVAEAEPKETKDDTTAKAAPQPSGASAPRIGAMASMQAKIEIRQRSRAEWQQRWTKLQESRPHADWEDPDDVAGIEYATTHTGEYMLKISPDYVVKPDERLTADRKRREMVLLEEAMYRLQVDFNRQLLALRGLKVRMIRRVVAMDAEIASITERLGDSFRSFSPYVGRDEWPEISRLFSHEMLDAFGERRKQTLRGTGGRNLLDPASGGATGATGEADAAAAGTDGPDTAAASGPLPTGASGTGARVEGEGAAAGVSGEGAKGAWVVANAAAFSALQGAGGEASEQVTQEALDGEFQVLDRVGVREDGTASTSKREDGNGDVDVSGSDDDEDAERSLSDSGKFLRSVLAYVDALERCACGDVDSEIALSMLCKDASIRASMLCVPGLYERMCSLDKAIMGRESLRAGRLGGPLSEWTCVDRLDTSRIQQLSPMDEKLCTAERVSTASKEKEAFVEKRDQVRVQELAQSAQQYVGRVFKEWLKSVIANSVLNQGSAGGPNRTGFFGSGNSQRFGASIAPGMQSDGKPSACGNGGASGEVLELDVPVGSELVRIGRGMAQSMGIALTPMQEYHEELERKALSCRRERLVQQMKQFIELFDRAVGDLRREKFRLNADLKTAELRFLVMFQELMLLKDFEKKDNALLDRVASKRREMGDVMSRKQVVWGKLNARSAEANEVKKKSDALMKRLLALVPAGTPLGEALIKVFHKRIPRRTRNAKAPGAASDSESDIDSGYGSDLSEHDPNIMYDDVYDEGSASDGSDDGDGIPHDCSPELYEAVCELRGERLAIEDMNSEIQKAVDGLNKERLTLARREEVIVTALEAAERDIQAFQVEKQGKLNELGVVVRLRLSQIISVMDESNISDFGRSLIFGQDTLRSLSTRIDELRREKEERRAFMGGLRRQHGALSRQLKAGQQRVAQLESKCVSVQILKFGQLVDLEQLEELAVNTRAEELKGRLYRQEEELSAEIKVAQSQLEAAKVQLSAATRTNTQLLQSLADLAERQHTLEQELDAKQTSVMKEVKVAAEQAEERAVRSAMHRVAQQQRDRIEALTAEIMALKSRKTNLTVILESMRTEREMQIRGDRASSSTGSISTVPRRGDETSSERKRRVIDAAHGVLKSRTHQSTGSATTGTLNVAADKKRFLAQRRRRTVRSSTSGA